MSGSVMIYVQYLLGIGHLQRALLIADALVDEGAVVTLVTGGPPVPLLASARAQRIVQLEPVRARDAGFTLVDALGREPDEALRARRRAALLDAFRAARPDAVVLEGFPFARRAFRFELDPLIEAAQATRPLPRLLCSIRDILVMRDDPARHQEIVDRVRADFDAVLVHGDPALIRLDASFPRAAAIADRLVYTGYVVAPGPAADSAAAPAPLATGEVLVSAGGGGAGYALLSAALAARRGGCLAAFPWRILTGPNLPAAEFAALSQDLPDGVILERYRPDLAQMLRHCRLSISQAGYNTVLDILAARAPSVLAPFAAGHETEQTMRAERLAARGVVEIVRGAELSAESLAAAMIRAAERTPAPLALDTGGAGRTARAIAGIIRDGVARAEFGLPPD